ncbi:hypothetical protein EXIGLDRAFT_845962 [Exidia glandulosa HHB12029]|uniref:Uncharacterized protein n=1 Tax=Exidia glandulosa HHB12029 TaxID=1314781 RepID=A0A165B7M0_EXIGL|nr:hypothetical protein EXIGLDRAFT_845962 [Exidia glandulosa HHB12029]
MHLARHVTLARTRAVVRRNSSTSTRPRRNALDSVLCEVASLRRDPSVLSKLVAENREAYPRQLLRQLRLNFTLSSRHVHIDALLKGLYPLRRDALVSALEPSHARGLQKIQSITQRIRTVAGKNLLEVRYADAPFLSGQLAVQLNKVARPDLPDTLVGGWLRALPAHLVRLSTVWERSLFDLDVVRRNAVQEIRIVEAYAAKRFPDWMATPDACCAFMHAYASTRVAPNTAKRHWNALHDAMTRGPASHLRYYAHALAAPRTLDALHAVWDKLKTLPCEYQRKAVNPEYLYALHLARLGAHGEATAIARKYPVDGWLAWFVDREVALTSSDGDSPYPGLGPELEEARCLARKNRQVADVLMQNGLDEEDVLYMLSTLHTPYSHFLHYEYKGAHGETSNEIADLEEDEEEERDSKPSRVNYSTPPHLLKNTRGY